MDMVFPDRADLQQNINQNGGILLIQYYIKLQV